MSPLAKDNGAQAHRIVFPQQFQRPRTYLRDLFRRRLILLNSIWLASIVVLTQMSNSHRPCLTQLGCINHSTPQAGLMARLLWSAV